MKYSLSFAVLAGLIFAACSGGPGGSADVPIVPPIIQSPAAPPSSEPPEEPQAAPSPTAQAPITVEFVNGAVEKGPFIQGSTVYIQELDDKFNPLGKTFFTKTTDDLGSFELGSAIESKLLEIISQGFYFNEVSGEISESVITLSTLSESANEVNVNILTTLAEDKMKNLMKANPALTFADARDAAEKEVLKVFGITAEDIAEASKEGEEPIAKTFDKMDMTESGKANAALLAVSATLQGKNTTGELSEFISKLVQAVADKDGLNLTVDREKHLHDKILANGKLISVSDVRINLGDRYHGLDRDDLIPEIPLFEDYLDSDGDGMINMKDKDTSIWAKTLPRAPSDINKAPWRGRYGHASVFFKGKMWILGGAYYENGMKSLNDTWSSADGITWELVTEHAAWSERGELSAVVYDGKIWVLGGITYNVSSGGGFTHTEYPKDVWSSGDGVHWTKGTEPIGWFGADDGRTAAVFRDRLWVIGCDSEDCDFMKAWSTSDGIHWDTEKPVSGDLGNNGVKKPDYAGRKDYALIAFGNRLCILGGSEKNTSDDVLCSNEEGSVWSKIADAPWGGRQLHTSVLYGGKMWVLGGVGVYDATPYNGDAWFTIDGINWEQPTDVAHFAPRAGHSSIVTEENTTLGSRIWLAGGADGYYKGADPRIGLNDVWYYTKYSNYKP